MINLFVCFILFYYIGENVGVQTTNNKNMRGREYKDNMGLPLMARVLAFREQSLCGCRGRQN